MQLHHRKRHRILWAVLAPIAAIVLAIAVWRRPAWPVMNSLGSAAPVEENQD